MHPRSALRAVATAVAAATAGLAVWLAVSTPATATVAPSALVGPSHLGTAR